jgi:hypothetical protein
VAAAPDGGWLSAVIVRHLVCNQPQEEIMSEIDTPNMAT